VLNRIVPAAILAVALALGLMVVSADGDSQTPGAPLTKSEYFSESFHFMDEESKSEDLYYRLALKNLTRSKCAASARKYDAKLRRMVSEAGEIVPPPEIADLHSRLLMEADGLVRKVARVARQAKSGRWVCGYDLEHPRANDISHRIYRLYGRSGIDSTLEQLADLGYLPSGE
jgi:hypothetical protein